MSGSGGPRPGVAPLPGDTLARLVAIVRPLRLDAVMEALRPLAPRDVLVEPVRGYNRQKTHLELYDEIPWEGGFLPKVRLQFVVRAPQLAEAVAALRGAAHTGRAGDGKIFVHRVAPAGAGGAHAAPPAGGSA